MFAGAYLSIRLAAARRSCRLLCAPFWAALHCLSLTLPEFVDSGHRAGPPIVRRAFLEGGRYRT